MAPAIVISLTLFTLLILGRRLPIQNSVTVVVLATAVPVAAQVVFQSLGHSLEPGRVHPATFLGLHWTTPLLWSVLVINARELTRWLFGMWRGTALYAFVVLGMAAALTAVSWRTLATSNDIPSWMTFALACVTQLLFFPFTIDKKPRPQITTSPSTRY